MVYLWLLPKNAIFIILKHYKDSPLLHFLVNRDLKIYRFRVQADTGKLALLTVEFFLGELF